mgnify:CR=1 FL=1
MWPGPIFAALPAGQRRMVWVLAALALLAGCERTPPERAGSGTPTAPTTQSADPDTPASPAEEDEDREQQKVLVQEAPRSPEEEIALQRLKAHRDWDDNRIGDDTVVHWLLGRHQLPDSVGRHRTLLIYASRGSQYDCMACLPGVSFFEFERDPSGGKPRLLMASVKADPRLGYAGEAPLHRLEILGKGLYAVVFHGNTYSMGIYPMLTVFTLVRGEMRQVFDAAIGGSHGMMYGKGGRSVSVEWQSYYAFRPGPGPYLDLHLERRLLSDRRVLLDPREGPLSDELTTDGRVPTYLVYRFDGDLFRPVVADQRPPRPSHKGWRDSARDADLYHRCREAGRLRHCS